MSERKVYVVSGHECHIADEELDLPVRQLFPILKIADEALVAHGLKTVRDIVNFRPDLTKIHGIGKAGKASIIKGLQFLKPLDSSSAE